MTLSIEMQVSGDVLEVVASGEFNLADAKKTLEEGIDATVERGVDKMLVDYRTMNGRASVQEDYEYAMHFVHLVETKRLRHGLPTLHAAYVGHNSQPEFAENVAVNRGMSVLSTDDMDEAVRWLSERRP